MRATGLVAVAGLAAGLSGLSSVTVIPKTWDDQALETLEVPLPAAGIGTTHMPADLYYAMTARPIYKFYPVYTPDKEPKGYLDFLSRQEPQLAFDASKIKTREDWIRAGEIVFSAPLLYAPGPRFARMEDIRNPEWYRATGMKAAKDGTMPIFHYVVRERGKVELGFFSCAMCHTRVLDDGTVLFGGQSNFPLEKIAAYGYRANATTAQDPNAYLEATRRFEFLLYGAPWIQPGPTAGLDDMPLEEIAARHEAIPAGVLSRQRASVDSPPKIADLIGVEHRRHLDATGIVRQRDIADLMRYSALNQGADNYDRYGDFIPAGKLPDPKKTIGRYSDEQLYALALYVYSLKMPPNPHRSDKRAARGKQVFEREGCGSCHAPPHYTNNKLLPVDGFQIPSGHAEKYDVMPVRIGTDPAMTLRTRRGTGYYKVPSLRGVWARGPFEHNGSVATLEDWFDPRRLRPDYAPTGFAGYGVKQRAVPGHEYGLKLSPQDKQALIAFLKTL